MKNELLKFWAKTSKNEKLPNAFHPLICHLIDVAVVTRKMWQRVLPNAAKNRTNQAFGIENAEDLVAFIAGLHDLGKCSPPFALRGLHENKQTKELLKLYRGTPFEMSSVNPSKEAPHGYVTAVELPQILESKFGLNSKIIHQISIMIGGHHGVFPTSQKLNNLKMESFIGNHHWKNARRELAETLADLLNIKPLAINENAKLDNGTIMILAGLVSVADWIGSDTQFFECAVEDFTEDFELDLGDYLKHAETQAETALKQLGWLNWAEIDKPKEFKDLFPFEPRGLQTEAIEIAKDLKTAGIVVIESPMGEGKTEAAMFLADTFNANLGQRGIYFALPTQATSNQMFGRVEKFLTNRFEKGSINLQLQHGHSSLSAEFGTLKKNFQNIQGVYEECSGGDCVPHVVAAEWFTYRKRGLLAPFGVGTIDQALMAVLQTKHVFVRLFGLAHKTIIIDEVHAYDAYMSTLLERLLEWLAALGSPVILLSATLPKNRRDALIQAYQRGLEITESSCEGEDKYPRISYATDSMIKVRNIDVSTKTQTLHIERIDKNFVENLKAKLKDGGCVAIICNTVGRSQEIYDQLSNDNFFADKIDLLHSRFRFCDRETREKRVLERFGKPDDNGESPNRPKCAVLIATQIIEQSLDIDFDLMISDLAPIDLLLQRAGRLFRHERVRPSEFNQAELWIIQPEMKDDLPEFGVHKFVYDEHILLRTWLELQKIEQIKIPDEIERLIEAVYDLETPKENLPEYLNELWQKSLDNCKKSICDDNDQAENRYIKRPSYGQHISRIFTNNLEEDNPDIHQSLQAVTRLTEPTATVICLWEKDGKTYLEESFTEEINLNKKPYLEQTKEFLRCSLIISNKSVVFKFFAEEVPKGWQESALLRNHRVLKFDENRKCEKFGRIFCLDKKLGLKIIKKENENV
jgi:CRISPR-associated endonuclease/helicase Cas3